MKQLAYLGHTALISFKARLAAMQIRHLFLVRGNASYVTCGAEAVLTPIFNELGIDVVEYKEFSSNKYEGYINKNNKVVNIKYRLRDIPQEAMKRFYYFDNCRYMNHYHQS